MASSAVTVGIAMLALMLTATILSVAFATRGAMAANWPIVEVLHFIGARDGYIARQFQRHFLVLGLKGGAIGGGTAMLLFALAQLIIDRFIGTVGGQEIAALFGSFSIGILGYAPHRPADHHLCGGDRRNIARSGQPHARNGRLRGSCRRSPAPRHAFPRYNCA